MSILSNLKEKPTHVKSRIAFGGAVFVTLVIGVVWMTTLPARFSTIGASVNSVSGSEGTASVQESFSDILSGFKESGSALSEGEGGGEGLEVLEIPVEEYDTAALRGLTGWNGEATTTVYEPAPQADPAPVGEASVATTPSEGAPGSGGAPVSSEPAPMSPQAPAPEPKVILIGTTTNKTP